ncbi:MAG: methylenetetrahydrofolate--tRNA-(uracil(54)-C(5))-methyltransferase (FADH(2)-oxidizing) TrmFO [Chloroflexi bacterium]|nr:methylenetetrahydrofolate--tRNA-(uracil(54)-C(5))-methyltransferase (FADH(2)-oxidizing) TrmFO [Chloroflexota bacterium]
MKRLTIIGGGLSGCEAAWQAAQSGIFVDLYEMRPSKMTGAHATSLLSELVCSNSLGSLHRNRPSGLLKEECKLLNSLLVQYAEESSLPAGDALAVDRELFAHKVQDRILSHPKIKVIREEVTNIPPTPTIIASGPLTSSSLSRSITHFTGKDHFYFYDAISPIVTTSSINFEIAFRASRYKYETEVNGDYVNCPLTQEQYENFVRSLLKADRIPLHQNETEILSTGVKSSFFEACLPIEVMAARNPLSLSFGPMRPVGLRNPHNGQRPFAVVQLRQEDIADNLYNLVGFQTNLTFPEQQKLIRQIPGLENAEFVRFGQMHRNSYINSPQLLNSSLQMLDSPHIFFAGQIAGVEGYMGNIASGLAAGINASRWIRGKEPLVFPIDSMLGSLLNYITNANPEHFQPMKVNFGLLPKLLNIPKNKQERGYVHAKRSLQSLENFLEQEAISE